MSCVRPYAPGQGLAVLVECIEFLSSGFEILSPGLALLVTLLGKCLALDGGDMCSPGQLGVIARALGCMQGKREFGGQGSMMRKDQVLGGGFHVEN